MERRQFVAGLLAASGAPLWAPLTAMAEEWYASRPPTLTLEDPPERFELRIGWGLIYPLAGEPKQLLLPAVGRLRESLAIDGIAMPLIRVRDSKELVPDGYAILIHGRIRSIGTCEVASALPPPHERIIDALEQVVRRHADLFAE